MKYSLPLYFPVVKTNVEYKVIASFATQSQTTDAVKEALFVIRKWNPDWAPKHFIADYAEDEVLLVEGLFPGCSFEMNGNWKYCGLFCLLLLLVLFVEIHFKNIPGHKMA